MGALDELLASWRSNPDTDSTVALCAYLGGTGQEALVREVGATAQTWHAQDPSVMLSVGRMYLDAGLLPEAQSALVTAGKAGGASPKPFRYLGEVLLRRGDASRAEKVLARAIQLGLDDSETRHWHDRASFYIALQKRVGPQAVANEVGKTLPKAGSIPAPAVRPQPFASEELTNPRGTGSSLPRFDSAEEVSQVEELGPLTPPVAPRVARSRTMLGVAPPAGRAAPSARVVMPSKKVARSPAAPASPASFADVQADLLDDDARTVTDAMAFDEPTNARGVNPFETPTRPAVAVGAAAALRAARVRADVPLPSPPRLPTGNASREMATPLVRPPASMPALPKAAPSAASPLRPRPTPAAPLSFAEPEPFIPFSETGYGSVAPTRSYDSGPPPPGVLLEHLAQVGVFEAGGGAAPAWERPARPKTRSPWVFVVGSLVLVAAGFGGWEYAKRSKADRVQRAAALSSEVDRLLHSGGLAELRSTDQKLSQVFELDSLSRRAARLWLENRVLSALLTSDESRGIDSAIHRGRTVGLPDKELAFGRMASFLVEGDLAGAAAQLPQWDKEASRDAYYQLAAGAVLERAGDLRAIERYEASRALDRKLVAADLLLARLALLELGKERAAQLLADIKSKLGDQASGRAIRALAWVVDRSRSDEPPLDARLAADDIAKLPAPLAAIPAMVDAARAVRSGDREKLASSLDAAIQRADTPSLAAGLGFLAIEAGDEQLARKAALRAVGFAALYPRARTLAARVALLGGRIDEAQKAIEQLDPASADVAVVRAVAAYESLDPAAVAEALKVLGNGDDSSHFLALAAGPGVLSGTRYPSPTEREAMRDPSVPWGELVAADSALDQNDLVAAGAILSVRTGDALRAVHLLRLARLRRYQGKASEALAASGAALEGNVSVPVLIERTYDLVLADDLAGARTLLAKYPVIVGPLGGWLSAFVDGHGQEKSEKAHAAARAAKLELPPDGSALSVRLLVLRALIAAGDKRAKDYLRALARVAAKHPDFVIAIQETG